MGKLNKNRKMKFCLTSFGLLLLPVVVFLLKVLSDVAYIQNCGTALLADSAFCTNCGAKQ